MEQENKNVSLWVDKYRPKSLEELTFHSELSKRLKTLVGVIGLICLSLTKLNKEYVWS